jgi:magnesium transporter
MRKKLVSVPEFWTVGQTIDHLRANHDTLPSDFYVLFVTDPKFKLAGSVMLSRVMTSIRDVKIQDIMSPDVHAIEATIDQEEVSHIFRKYGLVEAPVVNNSERLMGVITVDDVVDVIKDEDEEDILLLGGVSQQDFHIGVRDTIKSRFPWLFINLFTAIIASLVIERFDGAIAQIVALAVLMPIVASMGGNAGIQAVTVSIRALTTKELKPSNAFSAIRKELFVGGINGILLAIIMGTGIFLWYQDTQLAFVFGAATVITLFSGGLAGVLVPIILQRMKIDPAVASGVILTTVTDVIGFLAFLGLATMLLIS